MKCIKIRSIIITSYLMLQHDSVYE